MPFALVPVWDGARLEVEVLHPWGPLGGSCREPVVAGCFRYLRGQGIAAWCCRYNTRGVGASETGGVAAWLATPSQRNERDVRDLLSVVEHALKEAASAAAAQQGSSSCRRRLWLVGYSHGSLVACRALQLLQERLPAIDPGAELAGVVAIAPPLGLICSLFLDATASFRPFAQLGRAAAVVTAAAGANQPPARLAILGTCDNFTSCEQLRAALGDKEEEDEHEEGGGGGVQVRLLEGADHFFVGRVREVVECVSAFILEAEAKARARGRRRDKLEEEDQSG